MITSLINVPVCEKYPLVLALSRQLCTLSRVAGFATMKYGHNRSNKA